MGETQTPGQGSSAVERGVGRSATIAAALWALVGAVVAAAITALATVIVSNAQQHGAVELANLEFLHSNRIQIYSKFLADTAKLELAETQLESQLTQYPTPVNWDTATQAVKDTDTALSDPAISVEQSEIISSKDVGELASNYWEAEINCVGHLTDSGKHLSDNFRPGVPTVTSKEYADAITKQWKKDRDAVNEARLNLMNAIKAELGTTG